MRKLMLPADDVDVEDAAIVEITLARQEAWLAGWEAGLRAGIRGERAYALKNPVDPYNRKSGRSL